MNSREPASVALPYASAAAGVLLAILCAITLATGVSQQWFEWVHPPDAYAARLVRDAGPLRAIVALDDLFIAAYVTATATLGVTLARGRLGPLHALVIAGGVFAGVLDLEENHQLLAMLRLAERGIDLPLDALLRRSDLSQLKWMLGHLAFVLVGVVLPARDRLSRLLRGALVGWQLPIGALVWTVDAPALGAALVWLRYGAFLSGFAMIAWLARPHGGTLVAD